jgi:hypothetical protein
VVVALGEVVVLVDRVVAVFVIVVDEDDEDTDTAPEDL